MTLALRKKPTSSGDVTKPTPKAASPSYGTSARIIICNDHQRGPAALYKRARNLPHTIVIAPVHTRRAGDIVYHFP